MKRESTFFSVLLLIFIFSVSLSIAQETQNNSIKIYSSFNFPSEIITSDSVNDYLSVYSYEESAIGHFSPAISFIMPNGNTHELEITRLSWIKTSEEKSHNYNSGNTYLVLGTTITEFDIALRYEYNFLLRRKNKEAKLRPYIGVSISPLYTFSNDSPHVSLSFPRQLETLGAYFTIIPRLNYHFNDKWFIDIHFPIPAFAFIREIRYTDNPALPEDLREIITDDNTLFSM